MHLQLRNGGAGCRLPKQERSLRELACGLEVFGASSHEDKSRIILLIRYGLGGFTPICAVEVLHNRLPQGGLSLHVGAAWPIRGRAQARCGAVLLPPLPRHRRRNWVQAVVNCLKEGASEVL